MLSVNTNSGAMVALQYLNQTNAALSQTENEVNTGEKVSSAADNGATFAIAQDMRGDVAGYSAVTDSLNRGTSAVDVAMSAGQSISDLLIQMKQQALSASDQSLSTSDRTAMNDDFTALRDQISTIVSNASFNGFDLIDGSTTQITALASADGSSRITVSAETMTLAVLSLQHDLDSRDRADVCRLCSVEPVERCEEVLDSVELRLAALRLRHVWY